MSVWSWGWGSVGLKTPEGMAELRRTPCEDTAIFQGVALGQRGGGDKLESSRKVSLEEGVPLWVRQEPQQRAWPTQFPKGQVTSLF